MSARKKAANAELMAELRKVRESKRLQPEKTAADASESPTAMQSESAVLPAAGGEGLGPLSAHLARVGGGLWAEDALARELAQELPLVFPALTYGERTLSAEGVYHRIERHNACACLELVTAGGSFRLTSRTDSDAFRRCQTSYRRRGAADPALEAARFLLFELEEQLRDFGDYRAKGWCKRIEQAVFALEEGGL